MGLYCPVGGFEESVALREEVKLRFGVFRERVLRMVGEWWWKRRSCCCDWRGRSESMREMVVVVCGCRRW